MAVGHHNTYISLIEGVYRPAKQAFIYLLLREVRVIVAYGHFNTYFFIRRRDVSGRRPLIHLLLL